MSGRVFRRLNIGNKQAENSEKSVIKSGKQAAQTVSEGLSTDSEGSEH